LKTVLKSIDSKNKLIVTFYIIETTQHQLKNFPKSVREKINLQTTEHRWNKAKIENCSLEGNWKHSFQLLNSFIFQKNIRAKMRK